MAVPFTTLPNVGSLYKPTKPSTDQKPHLYLYFCKARQIYIAVRREGVWLQRFCIPSCHQGFHDSRRRLRQRECDRYLKPWIIPEPEVMFIPRAREDECLVLASDGLWDAITNEEACEVARRRILLWHKKNGDSPLTERGQGVDPAAQATAEYLSMLALQKGSRDNISVIVVDLKSQRKFKSKS
ncbi:hypothetical protein F0562_012402 [Nyssa sinensis]|uniref:PPM-type phosphatase domain-containing protein n=1 Tax=Nyssa sinensis TaxID=561372 RepID=A0A5J4ZUL6_9ASTE|nr:hypothetical protein F0562_012402 [Nyssa sinensis]